MSLQFHPHSNIVDKTVLPPHIINISQSYDHARSLHIYKCFFTEDNFDVASFNHHNIDLPPTLLKSHNTRKCHFFTGQYISKIALNDLKSDSLTVQRHEDGYPLWPNRFSGSISHTKGLACCAISNTIKFVGVDVQIKIADSALLLIENRALSSDEQHHIASTNVFDQSTAVTLIFSAKEAIFKAIYPNVRIMFSFDTLKLIPPFNNELLTFELTHSLSSKYKRGMRCSAFLYVAKGHVVTWSVVDAISP